MVTIVFSQEVLEGPNFCYYCPALKHLKLELKLMTLWKNKFSIFAMLGLLLPTLSWANFGPWPQSYFLEGGLLSCPEDKTCLAPRMDDVATLKNDWLENEGARLERVARLESLARQSAEKILEIGQNELTENEESSFGALYMDYGSRLLSNISDKKIEDTRLWVSQSSPMFLKIVELEAKLIEWQNQIDQQEDPDLKEGLVLLRNEKYKEWLVDEELQDVLKNMNIVQKEIFPKEAEGENSEDIIVDGLMNMEVSLGELVSFRDCPKKVESYVKDIFGEVQFSKAHRGKNDWDPVEDKKFIRFLLVGNGFGKPLRVTCDKGGFLSKVKVSYEKGHKLEIKYKTKSDDNGVTQYRMPSRQEILSLLK